MSAVPRALAWAALAVLLLAPSAAAGRASAALPGNRFAATQHEYFLTGDAATGHAESGGLRLETQSPATQGSQTFLLPGVNALGVVHQASKATWFGTAAWEKDMEATNDSVASLYFTADAQATTIFDVSLYDVAPDGTAVLVDSDTQQFITALDPQAIAFPLHTAGIHLLKGHTLALEVYCESLTAAVVLQYGGSTPSGLHGLATRWLDSDGDGVPDSDETGVGRNPLNPNDPVLVANEGKDTDGDGLADRTEATIGTDPKKVDTDGDGVGDGVEVFAGTDPLDPKSFPQDANHNGLPDSFETSYFNTTNITPTSGPCAPGPGCVDPDGDPDHDGCSNLCEAVHGTDPNNPDTDGDGVPDGKELDQHTDPALASSVLAGARGIPEPVATGAAFAIGSSLVLVALARRP
jgi:hypothetical protein